MNSPPNDRRSLPRHIRDGEHGAIDEQGVEPAQSSRRRPSLWILLAVLAVFAGAWLAIRGAR